MFRLVGERGQIGTRNDVVREVLRAVVLIWALEILLARISSVPQIPLDLVKSGVGLALVAAVPKVVFRFMPRGTGLRRLGSSIARMGPVALVLIGIAGPPILLKRNTAEAKVWAMVLTCYFLWQLIAAWLGRRELTGPLGILAAFTASCVAAWSLRQSGFPPLPMICTLLFVSSIATIMVRWKKGIVAVPMIAAAVSMTPPFAQAPSWRNEHPPVANSDVLLMSVDTLRSDAAREMESFALLAERGVTFENTLASSSWTLPSMATVMTGLPRGLHGAGRSASGNWIGMSDTATTLAERLELLGYDTAAVVHNAALGRALGFDRGFAVYEHDVDKAVWGLPGSFAQRPGRPIVARLMLYLGIGGRPPFFQADHVAARAATILENRRHGRPLFMWLHFLDCHRPFRRAHETNLPWSLKMELELGLRESIIEERTRWESTEGRKALWAGYRHEISYVDEALMEIIEAFTSQGRTPPLIILLSDHGEEFFEHGSYEHGHAFYQEVVDVPLVISGLPAGPPPGTVVSQTAGHIDVTPTILAALGNPEMALPGSDLATTERTTTYLAEELLYASSDFPRFAVREKNWKLIHIPRGVELYDLLKDPGEAFNVAAHYPDVVRRLVEVGLKQPRPLDDIDSTSPEVLEALRALGYIQ